VIGRCLKPDGGSRDIDWNERENIETKPSLPLDAKCGKRRCFRVGINDVACTNHGALQKNLLNDTEFVHDSNLIEDENCGNKQDACF
jgi:hypothetical protein